MQIPLYYWLDLCCANYGNLSFTYELGRRGRDVSLGYKRGENECQSDQGTL